MLMPKANNDVSAAFCQLPSALLMSTTITPSSVWLLAAVIAVEKERTFVKWLFFGPRLSRLVVALAIAIKRLKSNSAFVPVPVRLGSSLAVLALVIEIELFGTVALLVVSTLTRPFAIAASPLFPSTIKGPAPPPLMTTFPSWAVALSMPVPVVPSFTLIIAAGYAKFISTLTVAVWLTSPTVAVVTTCAVEGEATFGIMI